MKKFHFLILFGTVILIFCSISLAEGQTTGFIISEADAASTLNTESSPTLSNLIDQVAPRFVLEFANTIAFLTFTDTPDELDGLLDTLNPRIVFQYANANRYLEFAYPRDLIGDTTPPQITDITTSQAGDTSTRIAWKTNEFADSAVECGKNSGVYTISISDSMFVLQHSMLVSGLAPDIEYFCRVSSQDLSGNFAISNEFSFVQAKKSNIFMPLIVK
jgi:hypothetical protein